MALRAAGRRRQKSEARKAEVQKQLQAPQALSFCSLEWKAVARLTYRRRRSAWQRVKQVAQAHRIDIDPARTDPANRQLIAGDQPIYSLRADPQQRCRVSNRQQQRQSLPPALRGTGGPHGPGMNAATAAG